MAAPEPVSREGNTTDDGTLDATRTLTLTDGVVAIAMTLLALDLRPDLRVTGSGDLVSYFAAHASQYYAFVIAFALIARYWVIHHRMMQNVERIDGGLLWLNMLFLFGISVVPLSSYIEGNYTVALSTTIFSANLVLVTVALTAMSELLRRRGYDRGVETAERRISRRARSGTSVVIPVFVAAMAWVIPGASILFLLYFATEVPGNLLKRRARRRGTA